MRAEWMVVWSLLPHATWPDDGLYGHDHAWFDDREIVFHARSEGEVLLMIQRLWHGFPDPPEYGLLSRAEASTGDWDVWGSFDIMPSGWSRGDGLAFD